MRRALDQALEHASTFQRARFLAAVTTDDRRIASPAHGTASAIFPGPATFPALSFTTAPSLLTFPVIFYAGTAYLEAVQYLLGAQVQVGAWADVETTMCQIWAMVGNVASTRMAVLLARILPKCMAEHVPGRTRDTAERLTLLLNQALT